MARRTLRQKWECTLDGNQDDVSEDEQVNAPARRAARALFDGIKFQTS